MKYPSISLSGGGAISHLPQKQFHAGRAGAGMITSATSVIRAVSTGVITFHDVIMNQGTVTDYSVTGKPDPLAETHPVVTITSSNTGLLSNPISGNCQYISNGTGNILFNNSSFTDIIPFTTSSAGPVVTGYVSGTVLKNIMDFMTPLTSGFSPDLNIFTGLVTPYSYNTGCWFHKGNVSLNCVGVWNSQQVGQSGFSCPGVLLSPRHIVTAAHFYLGSGTTVKFVDDSNTTYSRNILETVLDPSYSPYYPDIAISVLDNDLPNQFIPATILPTTWTGKLFTLDQLPVISVNQFKQLSVRTVASIIISGECDVNYSVPSNSNLANNYYKDFVLFDSSSPTFMVINNALTLLTVETYGGAGSATNLSSFLGDINTMMSGLTVAHNSTGTNYQCQTTDLSSFVNV